MIGQQTNSPRKSWISSYFLLRDVAKQRLCGYSSVGAVKQWEMTSLLCALCLLANRAGNRTGARVLLIWQMNHNKLVKWQNSRGAWLEKTTAICSLSFDLIRESASTAFDLLFARTNSPSGKMGLPQSRVIRVYNSVV